MTLRIWDEARMASNSLAMYLEGSYFVPYFEGKPDLWCTKPPILLWLQLVFMKTIGVGELALRLPSALAALLLSFLLLKWTVDSLSSAIPSIITILFLSVSEGFVGWHGVRTGDYDILLTLGTTAYLFFFFKFLHSKSERSLNLFFGFVIFAFWVKGIAALIFLPIPALYLLVYQRDIFRSSTFWIKVAICIGLSLSYYGVREVLNPGYLQAVYENEIGGRMFDAVEGHKHPFWYYITSLPRRFGVFIWLLIPSALYNSFLGDKRTKSLSNYLVFAAFFYLLVISISETKLPWYDIPVYPLLALVIGIAIHNLLYQLFSNRFKNVYRIALTTIVIALMFFIPYRMMVDRVFKPKEYSWDEDYYRLSYFLRDKAQSGQQLHNHILVDTVYCAHNKFYMNWLNYNGSSIDFAHRMKYIKPGRTVIVHQNNVVEFVRTRFEYELLEEFHNVKIYRILRKKEPDSS